MLSDGSGASDHALAAALATAVIERAVLRASAEGVSICPPREVRPVAVLH
jgi:hypothetical protein